MVELSQTSGLRVAVEGCGHGVLHSIYASVEKACAELQWPGVDLLIIGGDFQAVRNAADFACVSIPAKYRDIQDFHEYYSGARQAPYLTVFIGGNHEASNYLFELHYGGWVAPKIYYLGAANVIRVGPLRIAGLSGIWKGYSYNKTHHERIPYNQDDVKTAYHVREWDVRKLLQVRTQVDVGLSHDWPRRIEMDGDYNDLFRKKSDFRSDSEEGRLGSVAAKYVLDRLRPRYWFSAHLHCKFSALVRHDATSQDTVNDAMTGPLKNPVKNMDEIELDMDDVDGEQSKHTADLATPAKNGDEIKLNLNDDAHGTADEATPRCNLVDQNVLQAEVRTQLPTSFAPAAAPAVPHWQPVSHPAAIDNKTTQFLALDKCLPHRSFLQLLSIDDGNSTTVQRPVKLEYDHEWLAITRVFAPALEIGRPEAQIPVNQGEMYYLDQIKEEEAWIEANLVKNNRMSIPENFEVTAPIYDASRGLKFEKGPREYTNNQTVAFCDLVGIPNPFHFTQEERENRLQAGPRPEEQRDAGPSRGARGHRHRGRNHHRDGRAGRGGRRGY